MIHAGESSARAEDPEATTLHQNSQGSAVRKGE